MGVEIKFFKAKRFWLISGLIVFGGISGYLALNKFAERYVTSYIPRLEDRISRRFGHPLKIGQYQGLRLWGVHVGPSAFLKGKNDNSIATVSGLTFQLAPIASLISRRPVAILTPHDAELILKDNGNKPLWVFGMPKTTRLPKFDLKLRLNKSSRIFIEPSAQRIAINSNASIQLFEKKINGVFKFDLFDKGSITLKGNTFWNKFNFQGHAHIDDLNLKSLNNVFFQHHSVQANGIAEGDFRLSLQNGKVGCKGILNLKDLNLKQLNKQESLSSSKTSINCRRNNIQIVKSEWEYGPWNSLISGNVSTNDPNDLKLDLQTLIRLKQDKTSDLSIDATLPFLLKQEGLDLGNLFARINLKPFNLAQLESILGIPLAGMVSAKGTLKGPLKSLESDIVLDVDNPKLGAARLQENWRGSFKGSFGSGAKLTMSTVGAAVPGELFANFNSHWLFEDLTFSRLDGQITIKNSLNSFEWGIRNFRVDKIELSSFLERSFTRIFGQITGKGSFKLKPFFIDGDITYASPRYAGLKLREAQINGRYFDKSYLLNSELFPGDGGQISISAEGKVNGAILARADVKDVSPRWITQSAFQFLELNKRMPIAIGKAKDLEGFAIDQPELLDEQLQKVAISNWLLSIGSVKQDKQNLKSIRNIINPSDLQGRISGIVQVQGSELSKINLDLKASGKVWLKGQNVNIQEIKPFNATFQGYLKQEGGAFLFTNVPLSLISLFVQVPSSLSGMVGIAGKYRFNDGTPEVTADLVLNNAFLAESAFVLEKAKIWASASIVDLDLSLRSLNSKEAVKLYGQIPLTPLSNFDLRIESHGDALNFLDGLTGELVTFQSGSSDLRLLIRGTLNKPIANGFFMIRNGQFSLFDKDIRDFNTEMVFDFQRLEVINLRADVGSKGNLSGKGDMAMLGSQGSETVPLSVDITNVEINRKNSVLKITSNLVLNGSVLRPIIGGEVLLEKGLLSIQGLGFSSNNTNDKVYENRSVNRQLPEQSWDRRTPLDLFIKDTISSTVKTFSPNFPKSLSNISLDNLRLNLGKDFRIVSQPLTSFDAEGFLNLDGPIDKDLRLKGVVRLKNGRVNLFTTTFNLDKRETNVAVFAPSMGFIPFIDLKMVARVSDTIKDPRNLASSNDLALNGSSSGGIGGSRLVKVQISATGPADRLTDSFQISSTPPLPKNKLLNLIGGNSLSLLFEEGRQSEILANVLSTSFVSPLLGNITGTISDRIQFSVYPAFVRAPDGVNKNLDSQRDNSNSSSDEFSTQQAWVAEMGLDVTDRVNFSIQVTPNRDDIPPQGTLNYQLNSNLGVLGSVDKNGNWQSEFQIYLRY